MKKIEPNFLKQRSVVELFARISLVGVFLLFPIKLGAANTLLALTVLFWLLSGNFKVKWLAIAQNPITKAALLMFGLVLIGATYSIGPTGAILQALNKYSKFLFLLMTLTLLVDAQWRERCWRAFAIAMIFTLASTYAGLWVHVPWAAAATPSGWGADHTVLKDYIAQGLLMATFAALSLTKAFEEKRPLLRVSWAALSVLASLSILFLSSGRTGYLAIIVALSVYAFSISPKRMRLVVALAAALALSTLLSLSTSANQRLTQVYTEAKSQLSGPAALQQLDGATSTGARLIMWSFSIDQIKERPLLGSGTGSYRAVSNQVCGDSPECPANNVHPHNQFLLFGVELGVIGILSYLFYLYSAAQASRRLQSPKRALLLSFLSIMVVGSLTHGALWLAVENHLFTFVLALLMAEVGASRDH
jgi:O-antigen ligase